LILLGPSLERSVASSRLIFSEVSSPESSYGRKRGSYDIYVDRVRENFCGKMVDQEYVYW
jgi:hypothetical protein